MPCTFLGTIHARGDHPDVWHCLGGFDVCTLKDEGLQGRTGPLAVCEKCPLYRDTGRPKLSIVMPMFRRRDSVEMTIQAIKIYHPEIRPYVEIVVCDNEAQESENGKAIRQLMDSFKGQWQCKYVAFRDYQGTAVGKQKAIEAASGHAILCIDSHVFLPPGSIARLIAWYDANPGTNDLYQGPCWRTDLYNEKGEALFTGTHLEPRWSGGMFGVWGNDPKALGDTPYEIEANGMGLFSCRKEAWPGFDPDSRGFGVEEFTTHAKFKNRGDKTTLLPWLLWWHLFDHVEEAAPPTRNIDRVATYARSSLKTGVPAMDGLRKHFVDDQQTVTAPEFDKIVAGLIMQMQPPKPPAVHIPGIEERQKQHEAAFPCKHRGEFVRIESRSGSCGVSPSPCFKCSLPGNASGEASLWKYCTQQLQPVCASCTERIAP